MSTRIIIVLFALAVAFAVLGATAPKVRTVPVSPTSAASGSQMFATYCAACHGVDGRGAGPAAAALRTPPPNLTTLAARNHGKFPRFHVMSVIQGDTGIAAHGSKSMPVWGRIFESMDHDQAQMRLTNLTRYIESLQKN
jgi:mono/diheme cytochrome c family protein